ncbi:RidA family protein [Enterovirga rhinocerotis]|uniref:Enamine deaminase RidA (YjgF/YER057c/UK114 family) n=1 Tax=Enterovirga rhinocerotis TaxID=1339210 RepID=A0A4R7C7H7_9HYPH|nr:RidA family protein [Enterovirga rhinocerotis]TDR94590.1 enamine deaminase RidA (YjgF/YER057c/UK114 family) [Enterovirga rhinocerotis]
MPDTIRRHSPYGGILHEVVEHAGTLYFGGIVSEDLSLDATGQAADVMRQLGILLADNGSDPSRVLMATAYVTDLADKAGFNKAWTDFFAEADLPARATIGVADLGPGVKLELVVTAARTR